MNISRSNFLKTIGSFAVAAFTSPASLFGNEKMGADSADGMHVSTFSPHLNSSFHVVHEEFQPITLQLIEAYEEIGNRKTTTKGIKPEAFSLIFRGPNDQPLEQDIYRLKHKRLGTHELFLVPVEQQTNHEIFYQAVFCRLP